MMKYFYCIFTFWNFFILPLPRVLAKAKLSAANPSQSLPPPNVTVSNGNLVGKWLLQPNGADVAAFLGIPFAEPPTGPRRFQNPVPSSDWSETRDASQYAAPCASDWYGYSEGRSEDCLYLNVWTPNLQFGTIENSAAPLPVLVYIHGGCFDFGATRNYDPKGVAKNLAARDVVVVTIAYRLEIFGFFTTKTRDFPSNLGLKDQILALQWIKAEIGRFGGDQNRVTLSGQSAGAASVSIITYAPVAQGLIHGAIMQSGTVYLGFDGSTNVYYNQSRDAALTTNCITEDDWNQGRFDRLDYCMRFQFSTKKLLQLAKVPIEKHRATGSCLWMPVIDPSDPDILPDFPRNLNRKRSVIPTIIGNTRDEMWEIIQGSIASKSIYSVTAEDFNDYASSRIIDRWANNWIQRLTIWNHTQALYNWTGLLKANKPELWWPALVEISSGYRFYSGTTKEIRNWGALTNPGVYAYSFDYVSDGYPWPPKASKGVWHAMDLMYIFDESDKSYPFTDPVFEHWEFTPNDRNLVEQMGRIWTNFVKTGDPNRPEPLGNQWTPVTNYNTPEYYSLNVKSRMSPDSFRQRANDLYNVYLPMLTGTHGPTFPPPAPNTVDKP